ncbi:MAG: 3-phosphoshikimate 1-carboxyvinyltransferase, partial [Defluviitaleaceae bacterium]|nr:3-phosphoshikimate 1-carboxyvinyltransferase [Defluviitaleaceae bacterium]
MNVIIKPKKSINGKFLIPSDKSISHRAVMLGSIANGRTEIENFLESADCLATIDCFRKMGINIFFENKKLIVEGKGLHGLKPPSSNLDVKNSGTTMRLISGILSGQNFDVEITGDESIKKRPMDRIITPLTKMGADI